MRGGSLTELIVEEVATQEGIDPVELRPRLYDVIDPDALEALFRPPGGDGGVVGGSVEFAYAGYRILVRSDGDVDVSPHSVDASRVVE